MLPGRDGSTQAGGAAAGPPGWLGLPVMAREESRAPGQPLLRNGDRGSAPRPLTRLAGAAGPVLEHLRHDTGLRWWMLLRTRGGEAFALAVHGLGLDVAPGQVFALDGPPCEPILEGRRPRIVPVIADVDPCRRSLLVRSLRIAACAGVPVLHPDGELLGCLFGMDNAPQPAQLAATLPTIELFAGLLGTILADELDCVELRRRVERAELDAVTDPLTRVGNRRAWDQIFAAEEIRCQRYGAVASLISVDLDGLKEVNDALGHVAGDKLLRRAAQVIMASKRFNDVVARLGGDEFGILAIACDEAAADMLAQRVEWALSAAGIPASVGHATRHPDTGLPGAWARADAAMYARKLLRGPTRSWS
jgi:diguanylate cyclase